MAEAEETNAIATMAFIDIDTGIEYKAGDTR